LSSVRLSISSIFPEKTPILSLFFKVIIDQVIINKDQIIENIIQFQSKIHCLNVLNQFIMYDEFNAIKKENTDSINIILPSFIEILSKFLTINVFLLLRIIKVNNK
jgi:hypothetical protein